MKKRFTSLLLFMMPLLAVWAVADTWTDSNGIVWSFSVYNGNAVRVQPNDKSSITGNLAIPEEMDSYPVKTIADDAFYECNNLTSVSIPNHVTNIGKRAFMVCKNLETITLPNSLVTIEYRAFYDCEKLESLNLPGSLETIGEEAFCGCRRLTTLTIPGSVETIEGRAFLNCVNIEDLIISEGVKSIGYNAFAGLKIPSVNIPKSVTQIGYIYGNPINPFQYCRSLETITVDAENPNYYSQNNSLIERSTNTLVSASINTVIPNGIKIIGNGAFYGLPIETITIPNTVTTIGNSAFSNCEELVSITIPSSVTKIDNYAFSYCPKIESIMLSSGLKTIGQGAFWSNSNYLTSIIIPEGVTSIGSAAFQECYTLKFVSLPSTLTSSLSTLFYGCNNLSEVEVNTTSPLSVNEYCFPNRTNATLYIPAGCKEAYLAANYWKEFKEIVEIIGPSVQLKNVVAGTLSTLIPSDKYDVVKYLSITGSINDNDFAVLSQLTNLETLSVSADITGIPARAFQNHENLKSVSFTGKCNGLYGTGVGDYAFDGCTSLTSYNGLVSGLGDFCFRNTKVGSVTLSAREYYEIDHEEGELVGPYYDTVNREFSHVGANPFFGVSNTFYYKTFQDYDFKYYLSNFLLDEWFGNGGNLYSTDEETLYALSSTTFYSNSRITSVAAYAVSGNPKLEQFYMGNISTIGDAFLYQCPKLKKITCSTENTAFTVVDDVLYNKDMKTLVKYPCAKTTEELTIPSNVEQISKWAFEGTQNLNTITIEATTPPALAEGVFDDFDVTAITLYVPYGCKAAYEAADYWKNFNIVEMPAPEDVVPVGTTLPWGTDVAWEMKYMFFEGTDSEPEADDSGHAWYEEDYNDESWETLSGPIANISDWFSSVNTLWNNEGLGSSSYYLRRSFHLDQVDEQGYTFLSRHDDDLKVWINGELVIVAGFDGTLHCHHIPASAFREGDNTLAISVNDFGGEAFLDYSLSHLFFLQNVETEKYLNAGNEWGTHAVLADEPLPVQLYKQLDGSYTIFFPVRSYNQHLLFRDEGKSNVFVDYNGQDAPASPYWTITDAGNGNYYIQMLNESDTYLGNDPDREPDNDVDGDVTSGKNITWTLVPEGLHTQAQAERLQELITQANALHIDTNKAQAVLDNENSTYTEMLAQIIQIDGWINEGIWFEDEKVKELCVANWDTSEDGELSRLEAGAVTDLGEVFKGNTEITSFNELQYFTGLTAIGDRAFSESSHLTSVQLPEGLERIGESAFDRTALETIHFPVTLTSVGATAFQACENLTSIDFNGCTATIEGDAFSWCPSLTEVVIPSNITLTGWFTFAGCRNVKTLIIEEGNPSENLQATFAYCFDSSLETLVLPSTAIMGENMFEGCSKLKSVTFLSGDPGEKHFANNFLGCPDDVLFVIPEGTAESYLKRGYRNLSDKGSLGKVRELFENQVNRISNDIVANVADGDKDALNAAISAAREIVETAEDYKTIYKQIDAIKDAAKTYLATATLTALTEDLDVTGAMITNPDNDYFDIGWTIGFLGVNNGCQNANYSNEDCIIDSFVESWRPSEVLNDGKHSQTIKNLPAGKYRLEAKAIATWQDDLEQEVTGVSLYMGDQSTPLATANEKPQFFSVEFTNEETQDVEIGLKVENTTANWVALDDVRLYYLSDAVIEEPDNMLYVEETPSVLSGSKTELSISLKNEDAITAAEFYLQLPEGISLDKVSVNGNRSDGHQVTSQLNDDGYYHVVCYSSQNNALKESDGELFSMTLSCASDVTVGTYQANVVNILMKDTDKHNITQPNFTISIEVPDLQLGDANEDSSIDIGDIVEVVDRIMQRPSETFNFAAANLHYDQKINALDLVALVKLVLSQVVNQGAGQAPAMKKYLAMREAGLRRSADGNSCADELHVADFSIQPGESKSVSVELVNPDHAYNTIQFELTLPSGLSIVKTSDNKFAVVPNPDRLTTDFTLEVNEIGEGRYQFLVWTTNTEAVITGTSGELFAMTLTASADAETGMKQGVFSEQLFVIDEEGYEPADKTFNIRIGRLPGDANGDGYVTIADVMAVVDYILGNTPKDFDSDAANVNNDEVITIADAVSLVKMILEMP